MCGIAGFVNYKDNFVKNRGKNKKIACDMVHPLRRREPDAQGEWVGEHAVFAHSRLAVIDPAGGEQPMTRTVAGYDFVITYNGELYNTKQLKDELIKYGYRFTTQSDTEVLLYSYIHYGADCAEKLNGIYAFCIWDSMRQRVFLCRDRFGIKPLFYSIQGDTLVFGSEVKALLAYPGMQARVGMEGLRELFAICPARTPGAGVFESIHELRPARFLIMDRSGVRTKEYWSLKSREHTDTWEETVERVRRLMTDSIRRQLVSDVPLATLLSGGLDSSIITAVAAIERAKEGQELCTYSFGYQDNRKYFQPDADRPWADRMAEEFHTRHTHLACDTQDLMDLLEPAMLARDLPGMADADASLLYFCREIKKRHTVVLSGECADEIFGGSPWFHSAEAFAASTFPWCPDLSIRKSVLLPEVERTLDLDAYVRTRYEEALAEVPLLDMDTPEEKRRREIAWLNLTWFMPSLLERKDRMSRSAGLEVRVPFCDHRLVQYVWNIPWDMKNREGHSKSVLRAAAKELLPEDVLYRKKSPYPKTHNPNYEKAVKELLMETIADRNAPILALCNYEQLATACGETFDYGKPFFGQLMAGPQFLAYLLQVNAWLKDYKIWLV